MKEYVAIISFTDGCKLLIHGEKFELGWKVVLPAYMDVTCPHGLAARIHAPQSREVLHKVWEDVLLFGRGDTYIGHSWNNVDFKAEDKFSPDELLVGNPGMGVSNWKFVPTQSLPNNC